MDLSFTPEQNAFREEVREWIQSAMPPELREKADKGAEFEQSETLQWHKILFEKGWIAPGWPEEVGGTGWDVGQRFIFQEECIRANTPQLSPFGLSMVGPLIIQYGDDEQKERFLPAFGSDLAALQLRAERDGDHYVLNGQKTWTTYAQYAKWIFVLARTSTEGKKQEGISFLLANIEETPGIEVKPFLTTGGTLAFSETWFKDARVPVENRVGPENAGWTMAKALLGHERTLIGGIAESGKWLALCKRIAKETPVGKGTLFDDAAFRSRIARLEMRYRAVSIVNLRNLAAAQVGRAPGPESSILKLVGTELYQEITELTMDAMGMSANGWQDSPEEAMPKLQQWVPSQFNYLRAATIYGGSNEIQRNIVAKAVLGLPMS
jgi:alkylation response protein AidB-like acyl-CoA dehydrogenase